MKDIMKIINKQLSGRIEVNKSIFISNIYYVDAIDDVNIKISNIKKQYYDAKHNCFSYIIGKKMIKQFDDGEPNGTAGLPILNVLKNNNLINCIAIVTRYFGGVLLGASGLYKAYSDVVITAIQNGNFLDVNCGNIYNLDIDYKLYNIIKNMTIDYEDIHIYKQSFYERVKLTILVKDTAINSFLSSLKVFNNSYIIENIKEKVYYVIDNKKINFVKIEGIWKTREKK